MIVWIASYPRSGNTFFRTVLHGAFGLKTWSVYPEGHTGGGIAGDVTGHHAFGPGFRFKDAAECDEVCCVKTHDPPSENGKAIYLIRDGRASIASYYHFIRNFNRLQPAMQDLIFGSTMFGSWADHARAWDAWNRPDTLVVKFEDIVANPRSYFPILEGFLGIKVKDDAEVPGFEQLKACDEKFFRSGSNDAWRKDFSEDDHNLFWALHGHVMAEYGYCTLGAETHRAIRGAWRLVNDTVRLREERDEVTASRATAMQELAALRTAVNQRRFPVTKSLSRLFNQAVAVTRRN